MLYKKKDTKRKRKPSLRAALERCDRAFSLYIRMRDSKDYMFKYFRCPTCGRVLPVEKADCSHYFSRRHMSTRFDPDNCVAECSYDNRFNSSHLHRLGEYMRRRLGEQRFALLEWKHSQARKWTPWELDELTKYYKALTEQVMEGNV